VLVELAFTVCIAIACVTGHFVVVCGYSATDGLVYYKNPASKKGLHIILPFVYFCPTLAIGLHRGYEVRSPPESGFFARSTLGMFYSLIVR